MPLEGAGEGLSIACAVRLVRAAATLYEEPISHLSLAPGTVSPDNTAGIAGWSSQAARRAHNPEVVGSNPTPATNPSRASADALEGLFSFLAQPLTRLERLSREDSALPAGSSSSLGREGRSGRRERGWGSSPPLENVLWNPYPPCLADPQSPAFSPSSSARSSAITRSIQTRLNDRAMAPTAAGIRESNDSTMGPTIRPVGTRLRSGLFRGEMVLIPGR